MSKILFIVIGIFKIAAILIISWYKTVLLGPIETSILSVEFICFLDYFNMYVRNFKKKSFEKDNEKKWGITSIVFYAILLIVVAIFKKSAFMALLYLIIVLTVLELIRVAIYMISKKRTGRQ